MAPGQSPGARNQLDEQPGAGPADHLLVLGAFPVSELARAQRGPLRRDARSDVRPRRARGEESLVLLLAEHPPDRRGAGALLRGRRVPRAPDGRTLARPRGADPRGAERAANLARRRVLRAVQRLPAVHGRDLPPLPDPRRSHRLRRGASGGGAGPADAGLPYIDPPSGRLYPPRWRCRPRPRLAPCRSVYRRLSLPLLDRGGRVQAVGLRVGGPPAGTRGPVASP